MDFGVFLIWILLVIMHKYVKKQADSWCGSFSISPPWITQTALPKTRSEQKVVSFKRLTTHTVLDLLTSSLEKSSQPSQKSVNPIPQLNLKQAKLSRNAVITISYHPNNIEPFRTWLHLLIPLGNQYSWPLSAVEPFIRKQGGSKHEP